MFAVSYDPVSVLAAFATKHGITYPLLSDEGSRVIRALGLLNEHVYEHHAVYGITDRSDRYWGVPYPGAFLLNEDGRILDKRFQDSYRERETSVALLEHGFGVPSARHGAEDSSQAGSVSLRAYLDSPTYHRFQRLRLTLDVTIAPGWHVYGQPVPEGYVPLTVAVAPMDGLVVGEQNAPLPRPFHMEGLDEILSVYEGAVRVSRPLTLTRDAGDQVILATVQFQACTIDRCLPPATARFHLPVAAQGVLRPDD